MVFKLFKSSEQSPPPSGHNAAAVLASDAPRRAEAQTRLTSAMILGKVQETIRRPSVHDLAQKLIQRRRWKDLLSLLQAMLSIHSSTTDRTLQEGQKEDSCLRETEDKQTITAASDDRIKEEEERRPESALLHSACAHGAPLEIILVLLEISPELLDVRDSRGRNALHHLCSASLKQPGRCDGSVAYLLERAGGDMERGALASAVDHEGRTPLHMACGAGIGEEKDLSSSSFSSECDPEEFFSGEGFAAGRWRDEVIASFARSVPDDEVVALLCSCAPESLNVEDNSGCTPLEYAIVNEAKAKTVRRMRKASERVWKSMQSSRARQPTLLEAQVKQGGTEKAGALVAMKQGAQAA